MFRRRLLLFAAALLLAAPRDAGAQIAVAAASDLQTVMPGIVARFQGASGQTVRVSFGSSGNFVSQIQNGAPFDVFLSADQAYIAQLVESGHAVRTSVVEYAEGRLAIFTRRDSGIDISRGLSALADAKVRRIAVANPAHAPYGRAAVSAMQQTGIYDRVRSRLVLGENVSQAAQFAQTGNADVGLIALALTRAPAMQSGGISVEVPAELYPPIRQAGAVLMRSGQKEVATRFLAFLKGTEAATILRAAGFGVRP
jgi:molybdate transport system substrate-binding protein